jgi:hypothetical protein
MGACSTFESTLTMTAKTKAGDEVSIVAKDGALSNNISNLIADAQFERKKDGSYNTIVNLGSERVTNTDNQLSGVKEGSALIGAIVGALAGQSVAPGPAGIVGGGFAGKAVGEMIGGAVSPAPAPKHAEKPHGDHRKLGHDDHAPHNGGHHK